MVKDMTAKDLAELFGKYCNNMCVGKEERDEFAKAIVYGEHRTIQQTIAGFVFTLLKEWAEAEKTNRYDARNEATVKTARKMVDAIGKDDIYLPFI